MSGAGIDVEGATVRLRPSGYSDAVTDRAEPAIHKYILESGIESGSSEFVDRARRRLVEPVLRAHISGSYLHGAMLSAVATDLPEFYSFNESVLRFSERAVPEDFERTLDHMIVGAKEEIFEPGMFSRFATGLDRLFRYSPGALLGSLKRRLSEDGADPEVLAEIMCWVGRQEARVVREPIIELLSTGLNHPSPLVRDAAALGISYVAGFAAPKLLAMAIERESVPELREDLEDLVRSLAGC